MLWDEAAGAANMDEERRAKTKSGNILKIIANDSLEVGTWDGGGSEGPLDIFRSSTDASAAKQERQKNRTPGTTNTGMYI
jgi:hypothetical protein